MGRILEREGNFGDLRQVKGYGDLPGPFRFVFDEDDDGTRRMVQGGWYTKDESAIPGSTGSLFGWMVDGFGIRWGAMPVLEKARISIVGCGRVATMMALSSPPLACKDDGPPSAVPTRTLNLDSGWDGDGSCWDGDGSLFRQRWWAAIRDGLISRDDDGPPLRGSGDKTLNLVSVWVDDG